MSTNKRIGLSIVAVLAAVALLAGAASGLSAVAQAETWDYPLSNTDFETGDLSGWASTGAVQVVGGGMPEGVYAAELGWDVANQLGVLSQSFSVPTETQQVELYYSIYITSTESTAETDSLCIEFHEVADDDLLAIAGCWDGYYDAFGSWIAAQYPLSSEEVAALVTAGDVYVEFEFYQADGDEPTTFRLDNVVVGLSGDAAGTGSEQQTNSEWIDLTRNGSFETGDFTNWQVTFDPEAPQVISVTDAPDGDYVAQFDSADAEAGLSVRASQGFTVTTTTKRVRVSAWVKVEAGETPPDSDFFHINIRDSETGDHFYTIYESRGQESQDWTFLQIDVPGPLVKQMVADPRWDLDMHIGLTYIGDPSKFYVDDVRIEISDEPCYPLPQINPGDGGLVQVYDGNSGLCFIARAEAEEQLQVSWDYMKSGVPADKAFWANVMTDTVRYNVGHAWEAESWGWGPANAQMPADFCDILDPDGYPYTNNDAVCFADQVEVVQILDARERLDVAGDDEAVRVDDVVATGNHLGLTDADPAWDPAYDFWLDGSITITDVEMIASAWRNDLIPLPAVWEGVPPAFDPDCEPSGYTEGWYTRIVRNETDHHLRYWIEATVDGQTYRGTPVFAAPNPTADPQLDEGLVLWTPAEADYMRVVVDGTPADAAASSIWGQSNGCTAPQQYVVYRYDGVDPYSQSVMDNAIVIDVTTGEDPPPVMTQSQVDELGMTQAEIDALGIVVVPDTAPPASIKITEEPIGGGGGAGTQSIDQSISPIDICLHFNTIGQIPPFQLSEFTTLAFTWCFPDPHILEIMSQAFDRTTYEILFKNTVRSDVPQTWIFNAGLGQALPGRQVCVTSDFIVDWKLEKVYTTCTVMKAVGEQ